MNPMRILFAVIGLALILLVLGVIKFVRAEVLMAKLTKRLGLVLTIVAMIGCMMLGVGAGTILTSALGAKDQLEAIILTLFVVGLMVITYKLAMAMKSEEFRAYQEREKARYEADLRALENAEEAEFEAIYRDVMEEDDEPEEEADEEWEVPENVDDYWDDEDDTQYSGDEDFDKTDFQFLSEETQSFIVDKVCVELMKRSETGLAVSKDNPKELTVTYDGNALYTMKYINPVTEEQLADEGFRERAIKGACQEMDPADVFVAGQDLMGMNFTPLFLSDEESFDTKSLSE